MHWTSWIAMLQRLHLQKQVINDYFCKYITRTGFGNLRFHLLSGSWFIMCVLSYHHSKYGQLQLCKDKLYNSSDVPVWAHTVCCKTGHLRQSSRRKKRASLGFVASKNLCLHPCHAAGRGRVQGGRVCELPALRRRRKWADFLEYVLPIRNLGSLNGWGEITEGTMFPQWREVTWRTSAAGNL